MQQEQARRNGMKGYLIRRLQVEWYARQAGIGDYEFAALQNEESPEKRQTIGAEVADLRRRADKVLEDGIATSFFPPLREDGREVVSVKQRSANR